jgi:hypothetical protein
MEINIPVRWRFILFTLMIVALTIGLYWLGDDKLSDLEILNKDALTNNTSHTNNTSQNMIYFPVPLRDIATSLLLYIGSVLILSIFFTIISIVMFDKVQHTEIRPFDTKDKDLDGKAFSESIIGELSKMREILEKPFEKSKAERLPIPSVEASNIYISNQMKDIDSLGNSIAATLGDIGQLGIAGLELPVGPLVSNVYRYRRIGDKGCIIQGNLQKYENRVIAKIEIIRRVNGKIKSEHCSADGSISELPCLISDLAFEIAYRLYSEKRD